MIMNTSVAVCVIFSCPANPWPENVWLRLPKEKQRRTGAHFLEEIAAQYKSAEKITLVMDNLNTHTPESFYETFPPDKAKALWNKFEFVYTRKARKLVKHGRDRIERTDRAAPESKD
jgi:hypothetical protein